jgi:hypothetical protein
MKMIITMPFAGSMSSYPTAAAAASNITSARDDVLFVAASGNKATGGTDYPAGFEAVVSVAAVDYFSNAASFSQFNYDVEW